MMNTSQPEMNSLPDSDLELLSDYIDDQLGASERAELERRLGVEPRLRAELEDLRTTTTLLRSLEPVRPPRSFTLSQATAPRRWGSLPLAWFMQLGGGLAGLALVLIASLQMIGGVGGNTAPAPAPPAAAVQAPAATQAPSAMPPAAAAPMVAAPAATDALPMAAAAVASESAQPTAGNNAARQAGAAVDPAVNDSDGDGDGDVAGAPKAAPQRAGMPAWLVFGLGVALLALAIGSFFYTRAHR